MDQIAYFEQMRQKRRNEILTTAKEMILNDSLAVFTMQGLAQTLDISTVTLYKYYKNSTAVIDDLYQCTLQQIQCLPDFYPSEEDSLEAALQCVSLCLDELTDQLDNLRLAIILGSYTYQKKEKTVFISFQFLSDYLHKHFEPLLYDALEQNSLNTVFSPSDITSQIADICASFIQFTALQKTGPGKEITKKIEGQKTALLHQIRNILLNNI